MTRAFQSVSADERSEEWSEGPGPQRERPSRAGMRWRRVANVPGGRNEGASPRMANDRGRQTAPAGPREMSRSKGCYLGSERRRRERTDRQRTAPTSPKGAGRCRRRWPRRASSPTRRAQESGRQAATPSRKRTEQGGKRQAESGGVATANALRAAATAFFCCVSRLATETKPDRVIGSVDSTEGQRDGVEPARLARGAKRRPPREPGGERVRRRVEGGRVG